MAFAVLVLMFVAATVAQTDYCNIASCGNVKANHTLCLYPTAGAASACGEVREIGVTSADQQEVLNAHNTIRRAVKAGNYSANNLPAAQAMPDLTWDPELATVAQRWVDQCASGHDTCRNVPTDKVGQNIAWAVGWSKSWTSYAIGQWFQNELPKFTQQDLVFNRSRLYEVGHLTQVIWANTKRIGCGFIGIFDNTSIPGWELTARTYTCNYAPTGNWEGQNIYEAKTD